MFKKLDPLLHSQLRLAIMSLLISVEKADFNYIKEKTGATSGNISIQIKKLQQAGYISVQKRFKDNYPQTSCSITEKGVEAMDAYVNALETYLKFNS